MLVINKSAVIFEVMGNEVVIVNLKKGAYYSLGGVGVLVWTLLEKENSLRQIAERVAAEYEGEAIPDAIASLIAQMQAEEILLEDGTPDCDEGCEPCGFLAAEKKQFAAPALQKFSDMQDLLLLDPIHEVDEMGWPNLPSNPAKQ
jgi:hypothetical protein